MRNAYVSTVRCGRLAASTLLALAVLCAVPASAQDRGMVRTQPIVIKPAVRAPVAPPALRPAPRALPADVPQPALVPAPSPTQEATQIESRRFTATSNAAKTRQEAEANSIDNVR